MSRPRVIPTLHRRSRHQSALDSPARLPKDADLAADVMGVKAQFAQRAAFKASASNVAANCQEVPRVPRVARQPR